MKNSSTETFGLNNFIDRFLGEKRKKKIFMSFAENLLWVCRGENVYDFEGCKVIIFYSSEVCYKNVKVNY